MVEASNQVRRPVGVKSITFVLMIRLIQPPETVPRVKGLALLSGRCCGHGGTGSVSRVPESTLPRVSPHVRVALLRVREQQELEVIVRSDSRSPTVVGIALECFSLASLPRRSIFLQDVLGGGREGCGTLVSISCIPLPACARLAAVHPIILGRAVGSHALAS